MASEEREDFLNVDAEIPGQKWCLLSFLSPENVLKNKDVFFFEGFVKNFEINIKTKLIEEFLAKTTQNINDTLEQHAVNFEKQDLSGVAVSCRESKLRVDVVLDSLQQFVKKNTNELTYDKLKEKYDDFMYTNKEKLEDEFYKKNNFHTTVRGLKIRGVYSSSEEAEKRSRSLRKQDPIHNIYSAEVGKWLPWDPEPSQIKEQDYAEEELNVLMKKYKENEDAREEFYRDKKQNRKVNPHNLLDNSVESNSSMFGATDLAIQRKLEKKSD
jgi:hypothetical protein